MSGYSVLSGRIAEEISKPIIIDGEPKYNRSIRITDREREYIENLARSQKPCQIRLTVDGITATTYAVPIASDLFVGFSADTSIIQARASALIGVIASTPNVLNFSITLKDIV